LNQADTISCTGNVFSRTPRGNLLSCDSSSSTVKPGYTFINDTKVWINLPPRPEGQGNIHIHDTQVRTKGDPNEPTRPEHYYKKKKKQTEIQGKNQETNTSKRKYREKANCVQVDPQTLRGVLEARSGGGAKKSPAMEGERRNKRGGDWQISKKSKKAQNKQRNNNKKERDGHRD
jgi:hypothetical protein